MKFVFLYFLQFLSSFSICINLRISSKQVYTGTVQIAPPIFKNKHNQVSNLHKSKNKHEHEHEQEHQHTHVHFQKHDHYLNHYHEHEHEHKHQHEHREMEQSVHGHEENFKSYAFHEHFSHYPDVILGKILNEMKHNDEVDQPFYDPNQSEMKFKQKHKLLNSTFVEILNSKELEKEKYQIIQVEFKRFLLAKLSQLQTNSNNTFNFNSSNSNSLSDEFIDNIHKYFKSSDEIMENKEIFENLLQYLIEFFQIDEKNLEDEKKNALNSLLIEFYDLIEEITW